MITLDTSAIVALGSPRDRWHGRAIAAVDTEPGPYIVPCGVLGEVGYVLPMRAPGDPMTDLTASLEDATLLLDCEADFSRIRDLMSQYSDLSLGFADASVIACAERNGGRVLTFDRRDFEVVAREGKITIVP